MYCDQGRLDEAEKMFLDVMNGFKAKLGSEHPQILTGVGNLASTYWNQGMLDKAEKLEVDVMNTRKVILGLDHPATFTSMGNLASTYYNQGRWDEAEKLEVDVLNARKATLGSDCPDTLTSMADLALYWSQSRLNEAHSLLFHAVKTMQQVTGHQHPTALHFSKQLDKLFTGGQEMASLVCHTCWFQK